MSNLITLALSIELNCQHCRNNVPVSGTQHVFDNGVSAPCTAVEQREEFMQACLGQRVGNRPVAEGVA